MVSSCGVDAYRMHAHHARCIQCGYEYSLARRHRTAVQALVCPSCSYAGWEPVGHGSGASDVRFGRRLSGAARVRIAGGNRGLA